VKGSHQNLLNGGYRRLAEEYTVTDSLFMTFSKNKIDFDTPELDPRSKSRE